MAYSNKRIEKFIHKVAKEAELAAQQVLDKYNEEFIKMIQSQIPNDDTLYVANGSATNKYNNLPEDFKDMLISLQYSPVVEVNFNLPYKITKNTYIQ